MIRTLAILSPSKNVYSETFIQNHKLLPFNIKYYYDGDLPTKLEGKEEYQFSLFQRLKKRINRQFSLAEYSLLYSLQDEKVNVVLAEYGPTAVESLKVIKCLKLPLFVHFHGYDASIKSVLDKYSDGYRKVFDYATGIVAVSQKMQETLVALGCPISKIIISPYGPNPLFFSCRPEFLNDQFISVGRFVEKKVL